MQRSYLLLGIMMQTLVLLSHIIILIIHKYVRISSVHNTILTVFLQAFQETISQPVIADIFLYTISLLLFIVFLLPAFHGDATNSWRPFFFSFLAITSQLIAGKTIHALGVINKLINRASSIHRHIDSDLLCRYF